jgi:hypothetical protein
MGKRLWMIVLAIGVACALAMWMKSQRTTTSPGSAVSEGEHFEGAAAIRKNVAADAGGFEGSAAIRTEGTAADVDVFEGAAAIRDEPAQ